MRFGLRAGISLAMAMVAAACGGGNNNTSTPTVVGEMTIGASGGTLVASDGVRIEVPPGAVSGATTFRVTVLPTSAADVPDGVSTLGDHIRLEPLGVTFALPVVVTMPVPSSLPGGNGGILLMRRPVTDTGVGAWSPLASAHRSVATIAARTTSFSEWWAAYFVANSCLAPTSCTGIDCTFDGFVPTSCSGSCEATDSAASLGAHCDINSADQSLRCTCQSPVGSSIMARTTAPFTVQFADAFSDPAYALWVAAEYCGWPCPAPGADASVSDAGTANDSSVVADANAVDAASTDLGVVADGSPDAEITPDSGTIMDASSMDGAASDAGSGCSSLTHCDAGAVDAGPLDMGFDSGGCSGLTHCGDASVDAAMCMSGPVTFPFFTHENRYSYNLTYGDGVLYWTVANSGRVYRLPLICADGLSDIAPLESYPQGLAYNSGALYWVDNGGASSGLGSVHSMTPPLASSTNQTLASMLDTPTSIVTDGTSLFWSTTGDIWRSNLDGTGAVSIALSNMGSRLQVHNEYVYWVVAEQAWQGIYRVRRDAPARVMPDGLGAGDQLVLASAFPFAANPQRLVIDDGRNQIYFTANGRVYRKTIGGALDVMTFSPDNLYNGLVETANNLYFADQVTGTIYKLSKDAAAMSTPTMVTTSESNVFDLILVGMDLYWIGNFTIYHYTVTE